MTLLRPIHALAVLFVFCAALWLLGLMLFVEHIKTLDAAAMDPDPAAADAIVVLTGGSERLSAGLELLGAGKAKKLFVSGVHPTLTLERVLGHHPVSEDLRACCIVLGHAAESTLGNAEETQSWLAIEGFHSLRLVTANYHMPRSLLLFRAVLPGAAIIPHPVAPDSVKLDGWWSREGTAILLITEYDKYLWTIFSLWAGLL
jgi:uncharacterized SAM-binding protein YcdF (DUF218 family)